MATRGLKNRPTENGSKGVSWSAKCRLRKICDEEVSSTDECDDSLVSKWYQQSDYKEFRRNLKDIAKAARNIGVTYVENETDDSCHGLQHLVSKRALQERTERRSLGLSGVLNEQERQSSTGTKSAAALAEILMEVSIPAQAVANQMAMELCAELDDENTSQRSALAQLSFLDFAGKTRKRTKPFTRTLSRTLSGRSLSGSKSPTRKTLAASMA